MSKYLLLIAFWLISCDSNDELVIKSGDGVIDINGNHYPTVIIGDQEWMAENLRTTHFNDGSEILFIDNLDDWFINNNPAYCQYNNNPSLKAIWGNLYNWHVAASGKACPTGWHVPTTDEWRTTINLLGGESVAGGKLKEAGITHWAEPNEGATNSTGFTATPGGYNYPSPKSFGNIGQNGFWWTSTESGSTKGYSVVMDYNTPNAGLVPDYTKQQGLSIRCVKKKN